MASRLQRAFTSGGPRGPEAFRISPPVRTSLDGDSRAPGEGTPAIYAPRDGLSRGLGEAPRLRQVGRSPPLPWPLLGCQGCAARLCCPLSSEPGVKVCALMQSGGLPDVPDRPAWSLADDVFQERFQAALSHTEGEWQPIRGMMLQLPPTPGPVAAAALRPGGSAGPASAWPPEPWQSAVVGAEAYAHHHLEEAGRPGAKASRAQLLFQYKPYSQQEKLAMGEAEVSAVVEAVFGKMGAGPAAFKEEAASLWDSMAGGAFGLCPSCTTGEGRPGGCAACTPAVPLRPSHALLCGTRQPGRAGPLERERLHSAPHAVSGWPWPACCCCCCVCRTFTTRHSHDWCLCPRAGPQADGD